MQVPVPCFVTVTTVFGEENEVATVQMDVVLEVTVTALAAVEETLMSNVPEEPIWSLIAAKLITFAVPTTIVGSIYMFEPRAKPPVASYEPFTNLKRY